jgi:RNase adapter protein RapZ
MSDINKINSPQLKIEIISFAYKSNMPPKANLLFDVRFIDNPFWVEHLRPLTGLEKSVQDFVLEQRAAQDFICALKDMIKLIIPMQAASIAAKKGTPSEIESVFTIAFGCTGGQHRSVAVAEESARLINKLFPQYTIRIWHREVDDERHILPITEHKVFNEESVS